LALDYTKEKFWQAVHSLATGAGAIQDRLAGAAQYLIRLQPDDLPAKLRKEFEGMQHELTKEEASGDEGSIVATTRQLSPEQGSKLANRILNIYMELHGQI
jgi:hypothetical protein